ALVVLSIDVNEPVVSFKRDPNGVRVVAGVALLPRPQKEKKQQDTFLGGSLDRLAIRAARLEFVDERKDPPVEAALTFNLNIDDVNTLTWDTPALLKMDWRLPGVLEEGSLAAQIQVDPTTVEIGANLDVTGIHPQLVTHYLPQGSTALVKRGHLVVDANATRVENPNGGRHWDISFKNFDFRDANDSSPWMHADEVRVAAGTLDRTALHIVADDVILSGLEARTEKGPDGRFHVLGVALGQERAHPVIVDPNTVADSNATDAEAALPPAVATVQESLPPRGPLPDITIHRLDLGLRKLRYQDFTRSGNPQVSLEDFNIRNTDTLELLGDDVAEKPPMLLQLTGRVPALVDSVQIDVNVAPLAAAQSLKLDMDLAGIQGPGIMNWLPEMQTRIDAGDLTQGRLTGRFEAYATVARRRATEFDFGKAFSVTLAARKFYLTNGDANDIIAGLDAFHAEIPSIDLRRQRCHIQSVELVRPRCRLTQEPNGLRVLDLVWRGETLPTDSDPNQPPVMGTDMPPAIAVVKTAPQENPPFRTEIGQVLVSGLDLVYTDTTVTPRFSIPLNGLDLDVRGLAYPLPPSPSAIRFGIMMTSGNISIEGQEATVERRPLFQEFTANGRLIPGKKPDGWVKAGLNGLDLRGLRGLAGKQGVSINSGYLDANVDVRVRPSGRIPTRVSLVLTNLSMSESSAGFVSQTLSLRMPLDVVIFILQDSDGSIPLTLNFTTDQGSVSRHEINAQVIGAAATVIGRAIARSPIRVGNFVADTGRLLTGTARSTDETARLEPTVLQYDAGVLTLTDVHWEQLRGLEEAMRKNRRLEIAVRHELGEGDMQVAQRLANPNSKDRQGLYDLLQQLRIESRRKRVDLASRTAAAYSAGNYIDAQVMSIELSNLEGRLGMIENMMDTLLEMMGPGGQHLRRRRTRQGALSLSRARLIMLRDALLTLDVRNIKDRITITQPSFVAPEPGEPGTVTITPTGRRLK
ncbi:DUF748 domain-containing protein, partial [Planctomycetota bacterium]